MLNSLHVGLYVMAAVYTDFTVHAMVTDKVQDRRILPVSPVHEQYIHAEKVQSYDLDPKIKHTYITNR